MLIFAVVLGLISAMSAFQNAEAQRRQQEYQADVARNNALAKEQQADIVRKQTEAKRLAKDNEKAKLKRQYTEAAGTNVSLLAAGNVAIVEGSSALDLMEGNLNTFADDMGELEYQKALDTWEGERSASMLDWEAKSLRGNASFLDSTAGSVGQSLLTAGLAGVSAGGSAYAMAGGFDKGTTTEE